MAIKFISNNIGILEELKKYYEEETLLFVDIEVSKVKPKFNTNKMDLKAYPFPYYDNFMVKEGDNPNCTKVKDFIKDGDEIVCAFPSDIYGVMAFCKLMEECNIPIKNTACLDTKWFYKRKPLEVNLYSMPFYLGVRIGQYISSMTLLKDND